MRRKTRRGKQARGGGCKNNQNQRQVWFFFFRDALGRRTTGLPLWLANGIQVDLDSTQCTIDLHLFLSAADNRKKSTEFIASTENGRTKL